jgi:GT2 family glycosyltransferase
MNVFRIAVLLTCHNRREKTITCIKALFNSILPEECVLDIFLVDDGSTDGTTEAVKDTFPIVNIIKGSGSLFWNQGMRLAWKTAAQKREYDFYLWLNDDTILTEFALIELLECYNEAFKTDKRPAIIVGECQSYQNSNEFSYGGRTDNGPVIPNGKLLPCKYINGNVVLVPKTIYNKLGNLSSDYSHGMGDFDYGLRANQKGFISYTTKKYIATCPPNPGIPEWCNPSVPLSKRFNSLYSPKGLNIKEYIIFRKKFWGWRWIIFALKAYSKTLMPLYYSKISK